METVYSQPTSHLLVSYSLFTQGNARATVLQNFCTNLNDKVRNSETSCFRNLEELGRKEFKCLLSSSRFTMSVLPGGQDFRRNLSLSSLPWHRLRKKENQGAVAPILSSEKVLPCYPVDSFLSLCNHYSLISF